VDALLDQLDGLLRSEVAEWAAGLEQAGVGAISVRR
jgi:hypothetical protein